MKAKILVNTTDLSLGGGVSQYLKNLNLNSLENVEYFQIHGNSNWFIITLLNLFKIYFLYLFKIKRKDIIHLHPSLNAKSFFRDSIFIWIALKFNKKVIVTMHGWEDKFEYKLANNRVLIYIFSKTFAKVHYYIVLGEIFKRKLKKLKVSENTQFFIEYTVIKDKSNHINSSPKNLNKKPIIFLFLSRVEKEKGIYIAIECVNLLTQKQDCKLIVAGEGSELELVKKYVQSNNYNFVEFVGFVQGELKESLFLKSDIFLFPTYYGEGLPTAILEAMLYGMPIISRDNAAIPEVVKDGINGFLTKSVDPNDFVTLIEKLINDEKLYNKISSFNKQFAENNFVAEKAKQRMIDIYQKVINDN